MDQIDMQAERATEIIKYDSESAYNASPNVYSTLASHQVREEWFGRDIVSTLRTWANRFIVEFELDIPELVLCIDALPRTCLGHFRDGHNGLGLKGEIALNSKYLSNLQPWEVLGILLHELLHAWQAAHGTPSDGNHHNGEFRRKAADLGLIIGRRGVMGYSAVGRFRELLGKLGIVMPEGEIAPRERRQEGDSKSKKWTCGCGINVRCAVPDLAAQCLKCAQMFRRVE